MQKHFAHAGSKAGLLVFTAQFIFYAAVPQKITPAVEVNFALLHHLQTKYGISWSSYRVGRVGWVQHLAIVAKLHRAWPPVIHHSDVFLDSPEPRFCRQAEFDGMLVGPFHDNPDTVGPMAVRNHVS